MVISDNIKYKNRIMNKLLSMEDVFTLIDNPNISSDTPELMKDINIFPYLRVPKTTQEVKNYICFDFNSKIHSRNTVFKDVIINVQIICHEDDIVTDYGCRHDVLAGVIADEFTWSKFLGFELGQTFDTESILLEQYHVRSIQFTNMTTNGLENGVKLSGN